MVTTSKISQQGMQIIYTFISCLTDNEDLAPKTLKEYTMYEKVSIHCYQIHAN